MAVVVVAMALSSFLVGYISSAERSYSSGLIVALTSPSYQSQLLTNNKPPNLTRHQESKMSTPQTPTTAKEKSTTVATAELKETLTLICAAVGPEQFTMAVFKKMYALQPEGRTVSSWEHLFRPLKAKAKEMVKGLEGDDVSAFFLLLLLVWGVRWKT